MSLQVASERHVASEHHVASEQLASLELKGHVVKSSSVLGINHQNVLIITIKM